MCIHPILFFSRLIPLYCIRTVKMDANTNQPGSGAFLNHLQTKIREQFLQYIRRMCTEIWINLSVRMNCL